jgi:hypothetical protein
MERSTSYYIDRVYFWDYQAIACVFALWQSPFTALLKSDTPKRESRLILKVNILEARCEILRKQWK